VDELNNSIPGLVLIATGNFPSNVITIEPYSSYRMDREPLNLSMVLAFIEGTLCYDGLHIRKLLGVVICQ